MAFAYHVVLIHDLKTSVYEIDNLVLVMEKLAFTFLLEMIVENRKLFLITLFF